MASNNRFMAPFEYGNKVKNALFTRLSAGTTVLFFVIFSSFSSTPAILLAEEKQPVETKNTTTANTTEGLLATTEQMIEQLILQIESQKNNSNTESREITENSNPAPYFASIPNIKPVNGSITSGFGRRMHPIYNVTLFHSGIDFSASEGTRVHSTGDGIVAFSGYDKGYGQKVIINHGYGYKTIYAHLSKSLVRQGQRIQRGEIIALSGNTGVSTGPHLHYEVQKDNVKVNPTAYFFNGNNPDKFITTQKTLPEQSGDNS
jgi:murein DD-endopeptidase MepM/ murein hydrolase activator NlpD